MPLPTDLIVIIIINTANILVRNLVTQYFIKGDMYVKQIKEINL